ncbi:hypothetical protein BDN72DRAFT_843271 [Pluteus cervinus]|uniref:Uncharacterized protein n=1 Tax=Pluteus cervinus TaxID=181527 RepID=A0ACD3AQX6_9AGAR|nr:hypothetical protein BDN72DRAFT_843271 [Pluteus cervinus]
MESTLPRGAPELPELPALGSEVQEIEPPKAEQSSQAQQQDLHSLDYRPSPQYHFMTYDSGSPSTSQSDVVSSGPASVSSTEGSEMVASQSEFSSMALDVSAPSSTRSTPEFDSSRPYRCLMPDCDRWFKRDYTRKVHMLTHRRTKERKPFGCSVTGCPERFSRKHDRLRHEVGRHGLGSEWRCDPCNRFFSSKATLERHILDKHGEGALRR